MNAEPVDRPLRVIGRYALYGKIAAGGMATVHFGRLLGPAGFSRTVAVKRLHPQFSKDPEFVAMFLDEARLAARIQHPNVVATVDVVAMEEELFLVMDYIRGESFSRLLRGSRKQGIEVSLGIIASVATGMLHGLHAAHEAKDEHGRPLSVVHRDVSPQNVLVGVDGIARVLDFGVAKAAARVQVTRDGQMKGKLSYMSPEQILAKGVDRRTDVFAAGVVLWEALTGRRLFDAEEASEVLRMILTEEIPPPSAVVPAIARNVDAIVMKALAREPSDRYATARDFAIALEEVTQLVSPREVGEWVERVAGETLSNREQTVAEIEAVSDASLTTETSPGFMKTLNERLPTKADAGSEWDEGPTRVFDPTVPVDAPREDATRIHVPRKPTSGAPGARLTKAALTPGAGAAAGPVRSRPPPMPGKTLLGMPVVSPPAGAAPPKTLSGMPSPRASEPPRPRSGPPSGAPPKPTRSRSGPPPASKAPRLARSGSEAPRQRAAPPPRGAEPDRPAPIELATLGFEDENEKTSVRDPGSFDDENETTSVFDPSKHAAQLAPPAAKFDDENETTRVYDAAAHAPPSAPPRRAAPTVSEPFFPPQDPPPPTSRRRTDSGAKRTDSGAKRADSGAKRADSGAKRADSGATRPDHVVAPTAAPTVIVQEHTDPAMFRRPGLRRPGPLGWLWDDPSERAKRLGALAATVGIFVAGFVIAARPGTRARPREVPATTAPKPVAKAAEPAPAPEPEPRGIDPSTLPPAPPEPGATQGGRPLPRQSDEERHEAAPTRGAPPARAARPAEPEAPPVAPREEPAPSAPLPEAQPDEVENPYAPSAPRAAAATPPKAARAPSEAPRAESSKPTKGGAADCSQPYSIDEKGIRRIKPECL